MAAEDTPCSEFTNWELDASASNGLKQEKQLSASQRRYYSFCRRKVSDSRNTEHLAAGNVTRLVNTAEHMVVFQCVYSTGTGT